MQRKDIGLQPKLAPGSFCSSSRFGGLKLVEPKLVSCRIGAMAVRPELICLVVLSAGMEPDVSWPPEENHIQLFDDLGELSFPVDASGLAQQNRS